MAYRRLDQILRAKGQVSEKQITKALHQQSLRGGRLGEHLLSNGDINETELVAALSEQLHIRGVSITNRSIDAQLFEYLPRSVAEEHLCLPIALDSDGNALTVAFADPLDRDVVRAVERAIHPTRLRPVVGLARQIHAALRTPTENPQNAEVDSSELSACLDLLDLAVVCHHRPPHATTIDTTRLIQEVAGRVELSPQDTNDLRLASVALDIMEYRYRETEDNTDVVDEASTLLHGLGLSRPASLIQQTASCTPSDDDPSIASQVLTTCRGLVTDLGTCSLDDFDMEKWHTEFCATSSIITEPAIAEQVIDVMRTRYVRERLFSPTAEVLVIGEDRFAGLINRPARGQGFRIVRASDLNEAIESVARRRPDVVCLFAFGDSPHVEMQAEHRIDELGVSPQSVLIVTDPERALGLKSSMSEVLVMDKDDLNPMTIIQNLSRLHSRSTEPPEATNSLHDRSDVMITGRLADLGTADLVQVLSTAHKTVRVDFINGHQHATLWFHSGRIFRAESDSGLAEVAFYHLIGWSEGRFEVRAVEELPSTNISTATTALLLEALRRIDEKHNLTSSPVP